MKKPLQQFILLATSLVIASASVSYKTARNIGDITFLKRGFPIPFVKDIHVSSNTGVVIFHGMETLGSGPRFYLGLFLYNIFFIFILLNLIFFIYKWLNRRSIKIYEATPEDIPGIMEVQKAGWLATYINQEYGITTEEILAKDFTGPERLARWKKFLLEQKNRVEIAKDRGAVVAFISLEKGEKKNKLGAVYVLPEYQGRGIGKQLIKEGLQWLGSDKDIILDVVTYNDKAIQIYEKLGFEKIGEPPAEDLAKLPSGKTMPEVRMVRRRA